MSLKTILERCHPSVRHRVRIEHMIVNKLIKAFIDQGYWLTVDEDNDQTVKPSQDRKALIELLFNLDEDRVYIYHDSTSPNHFGWVRLVFGNDGFDVICDYTVNLENVIEPIEQYASKLESRGA